MRLGLTLASLTFALTLSLGAHAGEGDDAAEHAKDFHFGIGAGLNTGGFTVIGNNNVLSSPFGGASLLFPLDIGGVLRIEPEVGFAHFSTKDEQDNGNITTDSVNVVRFGAGVFFWFNPTTDIGAYAGARLGPALSFANSGIDDGQGSTIDTTISRTDFNVGPAFGAEYYLSPHFALAAEAQLNFTILGDESVSIDPDPGVPVDNTEESGLVSSTNVMIGMRVFLF